jgi:4-hydroxy-2-oxoheptanedioate aldolase
MRTFAQLLAGAAERFGTWSQFNAPEAIDILGHTGFDFTIIDAEHGSFGMEAVEDLVRACDAAGIVALVRVPSSEQAHITRALDGGAAAVIVPGIRSLAEARRAVAGGQFAPAGERGACPCVRAGGHFIRDWPAYAAQVARETGVCLLIETDGALAEIDGIAGLPGLRALMVGPFDLSVALGHQGDYQHAEVAGAARRIIAAARAHQVPVMIPVFAPEIGEARRQVDAWRSQGVRLFMIGTDKILFSDQCSRFLGAIR